MNNSPSSRLRASALGGLLLLLFFCPKAAAQERAQSPDAGTLEARVADLFERSCARSGCHAGPQPQQDLHLGPEQFFAATVGVPSRERPDLMRVAPGRPDSSYLVMKITGHPDIVGLKMPMAGEELSDEEVQTVESWIRGLSQAEAANRQEAGQATTSGEVFPFNGWKILNLPTARTLDAGSWLFLISHRFNPALDTGYDTFYGLDGSGIIYLSLGYAFTDRLLAALGRSNASDDVELQVRYRLARQQHGTGWPVGLSLQGAVNWITEERPEVERLAGENFKFTAQASLTRGFHDRFGLALVPGLLINPAEAEEDEDAMLTLGLGARWRFYRNLALVGEWVPILSGYVRTLTFGNVNRFDTWGGGLEITTGGHVFQIVLSNSVGLATDQYLRGGDLDIRDGDVRLGFNIFRILNF